MEPRKDWRRMNPLDILVTRIAKRVVLRYRALEAERLALRERITQKEMDAGNAWDTHRSLMLDLLDAAEGNDMARVHALEPRVEHTRHIHAVASDAVRELRQQMDALTSEEQANAALQVSQHVARATWVLAAATVVLAVATVALIFATLSA